MWIIRVSMLRTRMGNGVKDQIFLTVVYYVIAVFMCSVHNRYMYVMFLTYRGRCVKSNLFCTPILGVKAGQNKQILHQSVFMHRKWLCTMDVHVLEIMRDFCKKKKIRDLYKKPHSGNSNHKYCRNKYFSRFKVLFFF
jgi:hypothetical protein